VKRAPTKEIPTELIKLLRYDPKTGELFWKVRRGPCVAGSLAGSVSKVGVRIKYRNSNYLASRIIWTILHGSLSVDVEIDHRDLNNQNNRPNNLRLATRTQNVVNRRGQKAAGNGLKGTYWNGNGWIALITYCGERRYLGFYKTTEEAHAAYVRASSELHGEFARAA